MFNQINFFFKKYSNIRFIGEITIIADFTNPEKKYLQFKCNDKYIEEENNTNAWKFYLDIKTNQGEIHEKWYPVFGFYSANTKIVVTFQH